MSCERFTGALTDHAAGAALAAEVRAHLAGCATCRSSRRRAAALSAVDGDLAAMVAVQPSVEFAARAAARRRRARSTVDLRNLALGVRRGSSSGRRRRGGDGHSGPGTTLVPSEASPSQAARVPTTPAPDRPHHPSSQSPRHHRHARAQAGGAHDRRNATRRPRGGTRGPRAAGSAYGRRSSHPADPHGTSRPTLFDDNAPPPIATAEVAPLW